MKTWGGFEQEEEGFFAPLRMTTEGFIIPRLRSGFRMTAMEAFSKNC